jgi:hypothetical protein
VLNEGGWLTVELLFSLATLCFQISEVRVSHATMLF